MIDVGVSAKFAGDGGEFVADAFGIEDVAFYARVEKTERGMGSVAKHFASAIVGRCVATSVGVGIVR